MTCAAGTAARIAASAASMVAATVCQVGRRCQCDLRAHKQFIRAQILTAQVDYAVDLVGLLERGPDRPVLVFGGALADQQAVHLDHQDDGDRAEQHADADGADAVPHRITGEHRQPDTRQREDEADQRAGVLEQHHRQFRVARVADEPPPAAGPLQRSRLHYRGAKAVALQADRDDQDRDRHDGRVQARWVGNLVVALVEREHRAEGEEHKRDHERVEEPAAAVSELVQRVGFLTCFPLPEQQQTLVAGVGDRVHRLGQHRRAAGDQVADELRDGDARVGQQGRQDRPGTALGRHRRFPLDPDSRTEQLGRPLGNQADGSVVGRHPRRRAPLQCHRTGFGVHHRRTLCAQQDLRAVMAGRCVHLVAEPVAVDTQHRHRELRRGSVVDHFHSRPRMLWGEAPTRWPA